MTVERMEELVASGAAPLDSECSGTMATRYVLEKFMQENWGKIGSQLPCSGADKGKCTIYSCSEARHIACYSSVPPHLLV